MRHYSIVFNTDTGQRRTIRITNPNTDLPVSTISNAIDQMLENDVFDPTRGKLESLNRMEKTIVEVSSIL